VERGRASRESRIKPIAYNNSMPAMDGCVKHCCENTLRKLRGVFVGVEIYFTGGVCTPPANQVLLCKT
jgi:hypothetical protein